MANGYFSGIGEAGRTIVIAILIAITIRTLAFEPFNIPSGSMKPTLLVGDYLFVSKFSYGYSQYSLPLSVPLLSGRVLYEEPDRGDVVVFKLPTDNKTDYIKRIVGLPGDTIQVKGGILHINGEPVQRERVEDYIGDNGNGRQVRRPQYRETLPNGRQHLILEISDDQREDNTPIFKVPEGHFFGMGDNRDNSVDSRFRRVGYIPKENLVGRADLIFYSTNAAAAGWWEFWQWAPRTRFDRLMDWIR